MRTTKVIAFSIPPEFEAQIHKLATAEHRTVSEFIHEAIRHYMGLHNFDLAQKSISKKLKKKGLGPADVRAEVRKLRK